MSLYPTKTRLRLLADVAGKAVVHDDTGDWVGPGWQKVTVRMAELAAAGWVQLDGDRWRITAAGQAVLDAQAVTR